MALNDDIAFLDRIPTFHVLGREALRILAISVETMHLRPGDVLFEEGEPADAGYVVLTGAVILRSTSDKPDAASTVAREGSLIGETALIVDVRRPATATALEHSSLWRISRGVFLRMLEGEPQAAKALRQAIAGRVLQTLNELDLIVPKLESAPVPASADREQD